MRVKYLMEKESKLYLYMEKTLAIVSKERVKEYKDLGRRDSSSSFFFFKIIYLFISCTGSLLLLAGFL